MIIWSIIDKNFPALLTMIGVILGAGIAGLISLRTKFIEGKQRIEEKKFEAKNRRIEKLMGLEVQAYEELLKLIRELRVSVNTGAVDDNQNVILSLYIVHSEEMFLQYFNKFVITFDNVS